MPRLSVVLVTYNEAANIARCLESVRGIADEIIVVDGQSTDNTVSIAKDFGARVIPTTNKPNFHINKNMAIDAAAGDWILQLDADEVVSPELAREIQAKLAHPGKMNGFWLPRLNNFLGRWLTKGGQYPDYTLRLYRRGKGRLPARDVHEQAEVMGETAYLKNNLFHYGTPDFANYWLRYRRYTSLIASRLAEDRVPKSFFNLINYLIFKPAREFFLIYFRHLGLVDGWPGFVFAFFSGLRFAIGYIKYWMRQ